MIQPVERRPVAVATCKMGQQSQLPRDQFGRSVIALLLVLGIVCFEQASAADAVAYFLSDLDALQAIFAAWQNTPDLSSNLDGWNTSEVYPCMGLGYGRVEQPNWRGVQCLKHDHTVDSSNGSNWNINVVGLSISSASIVGTLSPSIANLTWLTTLELTGNPNLSGPLPLELQNLWLNVLDVHDNGFNGEIPNWQTPWNLLQLDLSGNRFVGSFPFTQFKTSKYLRVLSIGNNLLTGSIPYGAFTNKTDLEKLDISHNAFTGELPDLSSMRKLIHLDVSGNNFRGALPDLRKFSALQTVNLGDNNFSWNRNLQDNFNFNSKLLTLNLSGNHLAGVLDLTKLPGWTFHSPLRTLSLRNNRITGVKFKKYYINYAYPYVELSGNPYCDHYDYDNIGQRCFCEQICFANSGNNRKVIIASVAGSVTSVILILAIALGVILYKNRRYQKYLQIQFNKKFEEYDVKPTIFSYNELRTATRDFHDDMKLGQGGYGAVYKGILPNGHVVAVKQLFVKTSQGIDEFSNEVVLITGMKHRNLVNLKGCCLREHQRLLVYEYVDNFDVDQVLLGTTRQEASWAVRLKICLGIARGLHYLHELAHPRVIHRDIKASNVLLDKNMEPKIADFGLALLFPDEQSHIMTIHIAGTQGYLAPEYASLGQLSDKVDVYSFGVLCLEIISGRRNIDHSNPDVNQVFLSKWAWILHEQGRLLDLVDPTLHLTEDDVRDVERVINVCLLCIQNAPERRPSMARVVFILQNDTESGVLVPGAGTSESTYESEIWSQRGSVGSSNNYNSGVDNASTEGTLLGRAYYQGHGRPGRGLSDDFIATVELSEIQGR